MTDEHLEAVRAVREEADRLRLVCIGVARTASLMHLAFDNSMPAELPLDQQLLLGALKGTR